MDVTWIAVAVLVLYIAGIFWARKYNDLDGLVIPFLLFVPVIIVTVADRFGIEAVLSLLVAFTVYVIVALAHVVHMVVSIREEGRHHIVITKKGRLTKLPTDEGLRQMNTAFACWPMLWLSR